MKKNIIIIMAILIILIFIIIFLKLKVFKSNVNDYNSDVITSNDIQYDEETQLYYLKDKETGEIIGTSKYEEDMEFYVEHPDYNPNPLQERNKSIDDYKNEISSEN